MGAMARELREEGVKNNELATNLIHVFYFLSSFSRFHDILAQHKIGATCMVVVAQEAKRHEAWREATDKLSKRCVVCV